MLFAEPPIKITHQNLLANFKSSKGLRISQSLLYLSTPKGGMFFYNLLLFVSWSVQPK